MFSINYGHLIVHNHFFIFEILALKIKIETNLHSKRKSFSINKNLKN